METKKITNEEFFTQLLGERAIKEKLSLSNYQTIKIAVGDVANDLIYQKCIIIMFNDNWENELFKYMEVLHGLD